MQREDVERLVERLRQTSWGDNVADTLCAWERDRQKAADLIEAMRADREQGARDYCDLMDRHDAHFVAWQSAKTRAEKAEAALDAAYAAGQEDMRERAADCARKRMQADRTDTYSDGWVMSAERILDEILALPIKGGDDGCE